MKRVLILGNSHLVVYKFRKELVEKLVSDGYDVFVSFPNGPFGEGDESSKTMGCTFIESKISRRGTNPIDDIKLLVHYIEIIKEIKPDVVLGYTVKPDIYGGMACRITNTPFIANITGLGTGLVNNGILKNITINLYKIALKEAKCIFFQNVGDKKFFEDNNIKAKKSEVIPGSGVNINEFLPLDYPEDEEIKISYIARVMKAKGIDNFLEAAKIIKNKKKNIVFDIFGFCEEDYKDIINKYQEEGYINYHGLVEDVRGIHEKSHCTVLPTYHPEGISNVLLESASSARPIITTNRIGCKETVINEVTGYLVRENDTYDLVEKLEKFINLTNLEKERMGILGRIKIEKEFDRKIVVDKYMKEIENIDNKNHMQERNTKNFNHGVY